MMWRPSPLRPTTLRLLKRLVILDSLLLPRLNQSSVDTIIAYNITGTATNTTDYATLSGTVTIAAGATTATINVAAIVDDDIVEEHETVIVTIASVRWRHPNNSSGR